MLFVPFFLVGGAIGIYNYFQNEKESNLIHTSSACSHDLLEQLTGVRLPAPISLAAAVAVTLCHIDHHATVFVPIVGLFLGALVGSTTCAHGALLHRKFSVPAFCSAS
jgi:hypothetical protein